MIKANTAKCPKCNFLCGPQNLIKEWKATPKANIGEIEVWIHYWRCPACGHKFRTATRIWPQNTQKLRPGRDVTFHKP